MRVMMIGAAIVAAMLASPAMAQTSDPDVQCFLMTAAKANTLGKAGQDGKRYDNAAYYYLALITQRYPDAATLGPIVRQSAQDAATGDMEAMADKCAADIFPKLQMIQAALAAARS